MFLPQPTHQVPSENELRRILIDDGCIYIIQDGEENNVNQYPEKQKQTFFNPVMVLAGEKRRHGALWLDCPFHNARQPGQHFVFPRVHVGLYLPWRNSEGHPAE